MLKALVSTIRKLYHSVPQRTRASLRVTYLNIWFSENFLQGGVRKYITRSPDLPCSRADAHAHKKWQCTVPEGEEYRRDKRVCVQVRLSFSTMMFFSFLGGGGDVLIFKQIDGSDLKVRRVGFFKKVTRRK